MARKWTRCSRPESSKRRCRSSRSSIAHCPRHSQSPNSRSWMQHWGQTMGLFDVIKTWRSNSRIKSLESAMQGRPTPALYLQLADAHKETGNSQQAAKVLKLGAARFPSAPEIIRRQAEAEKSER